MELDNISTEEECSTLLRLFQEIGGKESNPLENGETGARLEHKHGDSLLNDQSNDNSGPIELSEIARGLNRKKRIDVPRDLRSVPTRKVKACLEDEKSEDRDGTVTVGGTL